MVPEPAYGERDWLALSLVNTYVAGTGEPIDRLPDETALATWLEEHQLPRVDRRGALVAFHRLRGYARSLLEDVGSTAPARQDLLDAINLVGAEPVRPVLTATLQLEWDPVVAASPEAAVARDLMRLVASGESDRVRVCAAEDCDRMFVQDHRRRVWCSNACGNRVRARRHAARRRLHPEAQQGPL
jgi:predicted RNA-binding Zn ribbon-like protein